MTAETVETGDASIPLRERPQIPFQVEREPGESYYAWEIRCAERVLRFTDPASIYVGCITNLIASCEEMRRLIQGYRAENAELRAAAS